MKKEIKHCKVEKKVKIIQLNQSELDDELKGREHSKGKIISRKSKSKNKSKKQKEDWETMSFEEILKC